MNEQEKKELEELEKAGIYTTEDDYEEDENIILNDENGLKIKAQVWGMCINKNKPYVGVYFADHKDYADKGLAIFEVMQDPRDWRNAIFIPVVDEALAQKIHNDLH